jgi:hypothetical protein
LPTWACAQTIFGWDRRRAQPARRESDRHILMTGVYSNAGFDLAHDGATSTLVQFVNPVLLINYEYYLVRHTMITA